MAILSITFHTPEADLENWNLFVQNELKMMVENLLEVEKYILSEVESDMISEGKNTNLLLIFEDQETQNQFLEIELLNITERIETKFGDRVMVFITKLNEIARRF